MVLRGVDTGGKISLLSLVIGSVEIGVVLFDVHPDHEVQYSAPIIAQRMPWLVVIYHNLAYLSNR